MNSAVEQVGNQLEAQDASNLRDCFSSPLWVVDLKKPNQVVYAPLEGTEKEIIAFDSASKLGNTVVMLHWMNSDQVHSRPEGGTRPEVTSGDAPCTPVQSFSRKKLRSDETPEALHLLPSLSLGFGSSKTHQEESGDVVPDMLRNHLSLLMSEEPSSLQIHPQQPMSRPRESVTSTSTPSKSLNRIKLEVEREGPDLHKENLLCLSLTKHEKGSQSVQKSEPILSLGHPAGQPPRQRVLARLWGSKISPPDEGVCSQQTISQLLTPHTYHTHAYDCSPLPEDSNLIPLNRPGRRPKPFDPVTPPASSDSVCEPRQNVNQQRHEVGKSAFLCSLFPSEATPRSVPGELRAQLKASSSTDDQAIGNSHHDITRIGPERIPASCNGNCEYEASTLVVNHSLSLAAPPTVEEVRYMQLLPCALDNDFDQSKSRDYEADGQAGSNGICDFGKRRKPSFSQKQEQNEGSLSGFGFYEHSMPHYLVEDAQIYHREAKKAAKKKRQADAEQLHPLYQQEADVSASWHAQSVGGVLMQVDHKVGLPRECVKCEAVVESPQGERMLAMQTKETDISGLTVAATRLDQVWATEQQGTKVTSPFLGTKIESSISAAAMPKHSMKQYDVSKSPKEEASKQSVGLQLYAIPAYAQMPKSLSTFTKGEPSLPQSLEVSQKVPDSMGGRTSSQVGADWGKFLALSATPMSGAPETDSSSILPYQQRFKQLQAFLKQCDESDQRDHLQALRSLSGVARSGHAVELETRAIRLSLEEGKEMTRMKMLNVLGRKSESCLNDAGATPYGPRLPAPGAIASLKHL